MRHGHAGTWAVVTAWLAIFAASPVPLSFAADPVTTHPRLLFRAEHLADLRARAAPTNDAWAAFTNWIVNPALADWALTGTVYDVNSNVVAWAVPEDDDGFYTGDIRVPSEQYAMLFAFMSLIETGAMHATYVAAAKECLFKVIDQAYLGHPGGPSPQPPFRWDGFALRDRSFYAESFALAVDWLYGELTALEKAKIRKTFIEWAKDCHDDYYFAPFNPDYLVNDPALFHFDDEQLTTKRSWLRLALNNHYANHMRQLGMYAMSFDPADDVPNGSIGDTNAAGALTGYITGSGGADDWVWTDQGALRDCLGSWLYLTDYALRNDGGGGISMEGMQYASNGLGPLALLMLCLYTAGQDDVARWGPQVALTHHPFWTRALPGYLALLTPTNRLKTGYAYLGRIFEPPNYGDQETMNMVNDQFIKLLAPLGLRDGYANGTTSSIAQASRYIQRNLAPGGSAKFEDRIRDCRSNKRPRDAIYYVLLFDPSAPAPADPRPAMQDRTFYAKVDPAGHMGVVLARSDATTNATYFQWQLLWNRIDHQRGEGLGFGLWKNGLWLTKLITGYGAEPGCSQFRNTLALENNDPSANFELYDVPYESGSQWFYDGEGDPELTARSLADGFIFLDGDATKLYNLYSDANVREIQHASRALAWLKPDHVVVYDRAKSTSAGYYKRFWLSLPSMPVTNGNVTHAVASEGATPKGELYVTSLLPLGAAPVYVPYTNGFTDGEDMAARMMVEAPGDPAETRFLHVLQGTATGATAEAAGLVQQASGTAFEGVELAGRCLMFKRDPGAAFSGLVYRVSLAVTSHYVTGLSPFAPYDYTLGTVGTNREVTITSGTARYADGGGVLVIGTPEVASVEISTNDAAGAEAGSDPVSFTLYRSGDVAASLTVSYTLDTVGGAADATDLLPITNSVTFQAGSATASLTLYPYDDADYEGTEYVVVKLAAGAGYYPNDAASSASALIADNDAPAGGVFQFGTNAFAVAENALAVTVLVYRVGGSSSNASVRCSTANGTATAGNDYVATNALLAWADGETNPQPFVIQLSDDGTYEGNETFALALSQPSSNAGLGTPDDADVLIVEDDAAPVGEIRLAASSYTKVETGVTVQVTIQRINGNGGLVTVDYSTANGTALAGGDYGATNGTVTWTNGDAADKTIDVAISDDTVYEGDESFGFAISNATGGASLGSPVGATITITDDDPLPSDYDVGDGWPYPTIASVPWQSLSAGSTVRVHGRTNAFKEKILISSRGSSNQWIRLLGIPGTNGEPVVLDGAGATVGAGLQYEDYTYASERSLVAVARDRSDGASFKPGYVVIDGFTIVNAHPTNTFTDAGATNHNYYNSAGGVLVEGAEYVTIRNCIITNCANGIVATSGGSEPTVTRELLIERCAISGSGQAGQYFGNNIQASAAGITVQYCRLGRPASGENEPNLKDRSAGTVVRYNWIEGGGSLVDLADPSGGAEGILVADARFHESFVYGNVLRLGPGDGATIVHYGGDTGATTNYRKGTLHFHHNTVTASNTQYQIRLLSPATTAETAQAWNNIAYMSGGPFLDVMDADRSVTLGPNWFSSGWVPGGVGLVGAGNVVSGAAPGFVDFAAGDLHLATNSPCLNLGEAPTGAVAHPVAAQYVPHAAGVLRYTVGSAPDLGAFEASLPVDAWRLTAFGEDAATESIAGDTADADSDGTINLVEYVAGSDARVAGAKIPTYALENGYLTVGLNHTNPPDMNFSAQVCGDLAAWATNYTIVSNVPGYWKARDNVNGSTGALRFLRFRIVRP